LFLEVVENFFQHYKELEGKKVELKGWIEREETFKIVEESVVDKPKEVKPTTHWTKAGWNTLGRSER